MESIIKDFGIQPLLLAAQVVNFLILLFLLNKFLYKPILKVLAERKEKIAQSLKDVAKIEATLLKTEEEEQKRLAIATTEAQDLINSATKSAEQIIIEAREKATIDMENILVRGQEELRQEKEKMQQEIKEELAGLITLGLEKISGKVLNKKDQERLIRDSVKGL